MIWLYHWMEVMLFKSDLRWMIEPIDQCVLCLQSIRCMYCFLLVCDLRTLRK